MRKIGVLLSFMMLIACDTFGYRPTNTMLPEYVHSIAIAMFENQTRYRGFEFDLTQALVREIQTKTSLKIREEQEADSILTGQIVKFRQPILSEDSFDRIKEVQIQMTVQFRWIARHTGKTLAENTITESSEFAAPRRENLSTSTQEAFLRVAERIVHLMEENNF
ncbi:MAG: LptE family protein [Planctomycetota bacterium]